MTNGKYRITTNGSVYRVQEKVGVWIFARWIELGSYDSAAVLHPRDFRTPAEAEECIELLRQEGRPFVPVDRELR